jgi:hypothetical protein
MSGIKRSQGDIAFSLAIRELANHTCENCGATGGQLDCSHFYGRRHRGLRWEPLNAACLCNTCHRAFTEDPEEHTRWFSARSGPGVMELLREKRNTVYKRLVGYATAKEEDRAIAKHYREQVKIMREQRANGQAVFITSWY